MCSLKVLAILFLCYYVQPRRIDSFDFQSLRFENPSVQKTFSRPKDVPSKSSNSNDPIPEGFPSGVYGEELFEELYSHMQIVTRLINYFFLSQNLLLGTIAPELTRQFLQMNINITAVQGLYNQPSIGGFWQQHNFVDLMKNHTASFSEDDKERFRKDLEMIERLNRTQEEVWEMSESIDVDEYIDTLSNLEGKTSTVKDTDGTIGKLSKWLDELDKIVNDDPHETKIRKWFEEHNDMKDLEAAIKFATDSLKKENTKKFANLHQDLSGQIDDLLGVVEEAFKNQKELNDSLTTDSNEINALTKEVDELDAMKENDSPRHLLELLLWIRNVSEIGKYENKSLLYGLGGKGIKQALRDFQNDWLVDFLGDSSAVQLYLLFEPVDEFLRYIPEIDYHVEKLKKTVEEYGKVWHPFIDYLENIDEQKRKWTTLKLRGQFDSFTACIGEIKKHEQLNVSTHRENLFTPQMLQINKAIGDCSTLRRLTDSNLLNRFRNPNLNNIMETVNETIRFIDFEKLKSLEKAIDSGEACVLKNTSEPEQMKNNLTDVVNQLKRLELLPSSCSSVSSSLVDSVFNISDTVWKKSKELDGLWKAVDTVQSFQGSEAVFGELFRMRNVLRDNRLYAKYETLFSILNQNEFTIEEVKVMADGVELFKELSGMYKMKRYVGSWKKNLKKVFENIGSENQRNLLNVEWAAFQKTFNELFSQVTALEYKLFSSTDPDPYPILEASRRLQSAPVELKNILEHLTHLRKGSPEHKSWRDQEDLEKWIGEMKEVIGFGKRFGASHQMIREVLPVMKHVSGWLKFVMNKERKLLREEDETMCDCDMKYRMRDICFRMCEFASIIDQNELEDEDVEEKKEILPSWMQFEVKVYHFYLPLIALLIGLAFYDYLFRVDLTHY